MPYKFDCRYFSGYKPCKFKRACEGCTEFEPQGQRIAVLSLEALGAVLRSTCLLPPLKRKFPNSHITWITLPNASPLLKGNPYIDQVIEVSPKNNTLLSYLDFDLLYAVDKSQAAGAIAETISAEKKFGFGLAPNGVITPLNPEADYQYGVGLNDRLKFFENLKPETQQITETMDLRWERDPYLFHLSDQEKFHSSELRQKLIDKNTRGLIGYNTGCSVEYPYKKFTVEKSIQLIGMWRELFPEWKVVLLGGREDTDRHMEMKAPFADDPFVVDLPTQGGLRQGVASMNAVDFVFSGCSLGLHMAIALKKFAICWFGVSCQQEIDLYDNGFKLFAEVDCSPCWKKSCTKEVKCYDQVKISSIGEATTLAIQTLNRRERTKQIERLSMSEI